MAPSASSERAWVLLLSGLAAIHVFIFSAAFPFFNNVDEQAHFDLVVKYAHGHLPRGLERFSPESVHYIVLYSSSAYLHRPTSYPGDHFPPPPWTQPLEKVRKTLLAKTAAWRTVPNYEASQPPLYYLLAAGWWHLGKGLGFVGGRLLYWLRFLNVFLVAALVWLGYRAAHTVFPEHRFLRLGVPALLVFLPQTAFYSIQNDMLSALVFGGAFIGLVHLMRTESPTAGLGVATGLLLAGTFLTNISNAPLVAVSEVVVLAKSWQLARVRKLRAAMPALVSLTWCATLPIAAWLAWCQYAFGDLTGSAAKVAWLGWTRKPFSAWWHHPIFTPHGWWTFWSGLLATFWQGEFYWHRAPLAWPTVNWIYAMLSLLVLALAAVCLLRRSTSTTGAQRQTLGLGLAGFAAGVAFLGGLSIFFDFHNCFNPSRAHPYFTTGRLLLGALIPFLLVFVYGLDRALGFTGKAWLRWTGLIGLLGFMLLTELATDWPVFANPYNWFHL